MERQATSIKEPEVARGGTMVPVPPRPDIRGMGLRDMMMAINAYYEANKAAIIKEWQDTGKPKQLERWHLGYSTLIGLLQRWGLASKKAKKEVRTEIVVEGQQPGLQKSPSATRVNKGNPLVSWGTFEVEAANGLPPFPAFDPSWSMLVQVEWLKTYKELAGVKNAA